MVRELLNSNSLRSGAMGKSGLILGVLLVLGCSQNKSQSIDHGLQPTAYTGRNQAFNKLVTGNAQCLQLDQLSKWLPTQTNTVYISELLITQALDTASMSNDPLRDAVAQGKYIFKTAKPKLVQSDLNEVLPYLAIEKQD